MHWEIHCLSKKVDDVEVGMIGVWVKLTRDTFKISAIVGLFAVVSIDTGLDLDKSKINAALVG